MAQEDIVYRNWPFQKGQTVMVHWLRSPIIQNEIEYPVSFVVGEDLYENVRPDEKPFPWRAFPSLTMGSYYKDGEWIGYHPALKEEPLFIQDVTKGTICEAREVYPSLYPLRKKVNLDEKCVRYESNREIVFIPCMEIIRSLLCPTQFLSELIIRPHGLEELFIKPPKQTGGNAFFHVSNVVPKELISPNTVDFLI